MYFIKVAFFCVFMLFYSSQVFASDQSDKLVLLFDLKGILEKRIEGCIKASPSAEEIVSKYSGQFYGITEASKYWPRVVEIYKNYYTSICNSMSADDYAKFAAGFYDERMTPEEINEVLAFFSTPTGKKFLGVNHAFETSGFGSGAQDKMKEAEETYTHQLHELAQEADLNRDRK
ncbi:MAG: DUF2059 domain-containing protein [Flavobacteriaceae bacterium]|nr:DUF2059 domain-containing protein [Flavobacteriaceae bacterium]